ncbi:hypothetical protein Dimus_024423 [Dionaea muscipula]
MLGEAVVVVPLLILKADVLVIYSLVIYTKFPFVILYGQASYASILKPFIHKVGLSKDLCHLVTMCSGELEHDYAESRHEDLSEPGALGLHCLVMDTSMFWKRKNELNQVAQQATNVKHLTEVIRTSVSVMHKQWCDAMHTFHEKFNSLSMLIDWIHHLRRSFLAFLEVLELAPGSSLLVNSLGEAVPLIDKQGAEPKRYDFFEETFLNICQLKKEQGVWWLEIGGIHRRDDEDEVPAENEQNKEVEKEAQNDEDDFEWEAVNEEAEIQGESGSAEKFYDAENEAQGSADVIEEVPEVPAPVSDQ